MALTGRQAFGTTLLVAVLLWCAEVIAATTERVSVDSLGNEANSGENFDSDTLAISADGRFVAFSSNASNLVIGDTNNRFDIFVHDRQTGQTERVSVDSLGNEANGHGFAPAISADGRFVAFASNASNLVIGDTTTTDAFVHDRQTGQTERVSVDSLGNEANSFSAQPGISADGRFVTFVSNASNLVMGDTNNIIDIFVHDRQTGQTERVSVDSLGNEANGFGSFDPEISADGRFVAFVSNASNLVMGDTNNVRDAFVHDRQTGQTERVSVDSLGNEAIGANSRPHATISADGRFVAFASDASNLVIGDTNNIEDIFVHDRQTGQTERVSVDSLGNEANSFSFAPEISAHGRFVPFESLASNLVSGDTNDLDIFVRADLVWGPSLKFILSPVIGPIHICTDPSDTPDCPFASDTWEFWQHKTDLHREGGGIGGSDDTFAWDVNLAPEPADRAKLVYAVAPGKVVKYAGTEGPGGKSGAVLLEHEEDGQKWWSGYLHMKVDNNIKKNLEVNEVTVLGEISNRNIQ